VPSAAAAAAARAVAEALGLRVRVAHERGAQREEQRALQRRVELQHVHHQPRRAAQAAQPLVRRLPADAGQRDEGQRCVPLRLQVPDALLACARALPPSPVVSPLLPREFVGISTSG